MALVPYEPFRQFDHFRREWDQFLNDLPSFFKQGMSGRIDIDLYETENEVVAACDIPGLEKKEDVSIDIDNNVLSISGTLNRTHEVKDEHMHRRERFYGRFHRSVPLPSPVSSEGVTAAYRNGVLEIRMPKLKGETKKRIDIQFH